MVYTPATGLHHRGGLRPPSIEPASLRRGSGSVAELARELAQVESELERNRLEQEQAAQEAEQWRHVAEQQQGGTLAAPRRPKALVQSTLLPRHLPRREHHSHLLHSSVAVAASPVVAVAAPPPLPPAGLPLQVAPLAKMPAPQPHPRPPALAGGGGGDGAVGEGDRAASDSGASRRSSSSQVSQQQYQNMLKAARKSQCLVTEQASQLTELQDRLRSLEERGAPQQQQQQQRKLPQHPTPSTSTSEALSPAAVRSDMVPRAEVEEILRRVRSEVTERVTRELAAGAAPAAVPSQQPQQQQQREDAEARELITSLRSVVRDLSDGLRESGVHASKGGSRSGGGGGSDSAADTTFSGLGPDEGVDAQRQQVRVELHELERDMLAQLRTMTATAPASAAVSNAAVARRPTAPSRAHDGAAADAFGCCCGGGGGGGGGGEPVFATTCPACDRPQQPQQRRFRPGNTPPFSSARDAAAAPSQVPEQLRRLSPTRPQPSQAPHASHRRLQAAVTTPAEVPVANAAAPSPPPRDGGFSPSVAVGGGVGGRGGGGGGRLSPVLSAPSSERGGVPAPFGASSGGAAVNAYDSRRLTPLLSACHADDEVRVQELLDRGADPELPDPDGWTALHIAAQKGSVALVRRLAAARCAVDSRDCDGSTPLMVACLEGHEDAVRLLLVAGAAHDARDDDGTTALMVAAQAGCARVVGLLLRDGADPLACDLAGRTPLACAQAAGAPRATLKLLERAERLLADEEGGGGGGGVSSRSGFRASRSPPGSSRPPSVSAGRSGYRRSPSPPPHQNLSFVF